MTQDFSSWRVTTSDALLVVSATALASLLWNSSLTWLIIALAIAAACFFASHLLHPWSARFPRNSPEIIIGPAHQHSYLEQSSANEPESK